MRNWAKLTLGVGAAVVLAAVGAEMVFDIRTPRSDLRSVSALAALTLTSYGDYSSKVDQARAKYGDRVHIERDEAAGKWTIALDGRVIEQGQIVVKLAGMYGLFAVPSGAAAAGVFPFSFVPGSPTLSDIPSAKILRERFETFPPSFLTFATTDVALESCAAPSPSELGFGPLGPWLRIEAQAFCVVRWKGTHPSSMLITVTLANGDPWMRPFARWMCRRMTAAALKKLAAPDREPPTYAACILVDRPGRRRPGDAQDTFKSYVYEIRNGAPAPMN